MALTIRAINQNYKVHFDKIRTFASAFKNNLESNSAKWFRRAEVIAGVVETEFISQNDAYTGAETISQSSAVIGNTLKDTLRPSTEVIWICSFGLIDSKIIF